MATRGGGFSKPHLGAPLSCLPEEGINVGSLRALNLLFDPRSVRFQMAHYSVLPQRWCKQWRQGRPVVFGSVWALPRPVYNPGCQASYEGLLPNTRLVKVAAKAANTAQPAAVAPEAASPGDPH